MKKVFVKPVIHAELALTALTLTAPCFSCVQTN